MKRAAFAVPGDLDTPTGGYAYDKRVIAELRELGWQVDVIDLGGSFPNPSAAAREIALARLLAMPKGFPIVIDGLAFGVMADEAERLHERNPLIALVHHPLALETGIDSAAANARRASERAALGRTRSVIVTSRSTAEILERDYAVPSHRIAVIRPGVDAPLRRPRLADRGDTVKLLAVGSITPRKGYDILIDALAGLRELPWCLTVAGDTTRSEKAFEQLQGDVARLQLQERVVLAGAVTAQQLAQLYDSADVFVLASLFEGYGMVFGEAIAHGLPVVATAVGAAREIVSADAGLLVPPGDAHALRDALRRVIEDTDTRGRMAHAAHEASRRLPRWRQSAMEFARVLERLT